MNRILTFSVFVFIGLSFSFALFTYAFIKFDNTAFINQGKEIEFLNSIASGKTKPTQEQWITLHKISSDSLTSAQAFNESLLGVFSRMAFLLFSLLICQGCLIYFIVKKKKYNKNTKTNLRKHKPFN